MDIDVLNSQLYDKLVASQEKMKDWLQSQSFDDMMRNAREYLVREDIVLSFEFHDLSDEQVLHCGSAKILLQNSTLLLRRWKIVTWKL